MGDRFQNVPFPHRSVAAVPPLTKRREIRVPKTNSHVYKLVQGTPSTLRLKQRRMGLRLIFAHPTVLSYFSLQIENTIRERVERTLGSPPGGTAPPSSLLLPLNESEMLP